MIILEFGSTSRDPNSAVQTNLREMAKLHAKHGALRTFAGHHPRALNCFVSAFALCASADSKPAVARAASEGGSLAMMERVAPVEPTARQPVEARAPALSAHQDRCIPSPWAFFAGDCRRISSRSIPTMRETGIGSFCSRQARSSARPPINCALPAPRRTQHRQQAQVPAPPAVPRHRRIRSAHSRGLLLSPALQIRP